MERVAAGLAVAAMRRRREWRRRGRWRGWRWRGWWWRWHGRAFLGGMGWRGGKGGDEGSGGEAECEGDGANGEGARCPVHMYGLVSTILGAPSWAAPSWRPSSQPIPARTRWTARPAPRRRWPTWQQGRRRGYGTASEPCAEPRTSTSAIEACRIALGHPGALWGEYMVDRGD